jgi:hypothetical protein
VMPLIWALLCCFKGMEMSLIIFYPFSMHWECGKWCGGHTRPTAKNSDQTVMRQGWDSDAMVMEQWCLWFELIFVILKVQRCHWSYFILFECLGSVITDLVVAQVRLPKTVIEQWWDSDATVTRQWWNSDAFDLSSIMSLWRYGDAIDHILSFCNALGVWKVMWWSHKTHCQKQWSNSDETGMRQWCNDDGTVMPLIWAHLCHFEGMEMSLIMFYPFSMPWKCGNWSGGDRRPNTKNSDRTVMRQWCNSEATVMEQWCFSFELYYVTLKVWRCHWSYFILLQCLGSVESDLVVAQYLLQKTVIEQWWDSDSMVMQWWWNSDAFDLSSIMSLWRYGDVIDHILSFLNALEVW